MNLTYGDTSLMVRYVEAFLQNEYNNTLRVSGLYDTYTHKNLTAYASLPPVQDSNTMFDILTNTYEELKLFTVSRSSKKIIYSSKATSENKELEEAMESLQHSIFEFVKQYGWSVTQFISNGKSKDLYKIELTQDERKNIIPSDALSLINLSTESFIFNATLSISLIVEDSNNCCMIIPCESNTDYVICHRFDNPDPEDPKKQLPITIKTASSVKNLPDTKEFSEITNEQEFSIKQGEFAVCTTSDTAKTLLVSFEYNQETYNKSLLIIKKPKYWEKSFITVIDENNNERKVNIFIDSEDFIKNYWLVNSKYLDYITKSVINEYSSEEDILYIQELVQKVCVNYRIGIRGVYDEDLKNFIQKYQMMNLKDDIHYPIHYCLGYADAETEARLIKDADRNFHTLIV